MEALSTRALPIAWVVVNAALAGAIVLLVLLAALPVVGVDEVRVPVEVDAHGLQPPQGVDVGTWLYGEVRIDDPTFAEAVLGAIVAIGQLPVAVAALWLLRRLLAATRRGDPFQAASVRRLRLLGGVLVVGSLVVALVDWIARAELWERLPPSGGEVGVAGFALPLEIVLAGLLAYVLAEVFARGVALREDVEATI